MTRKILLSCGIVAVLLYLAADVAGALRFPGYSYTDQTISELVAIDAPSRPLLVPLSLLYAALWFAFALGIWRSARGKVALRVVAAGLAAKEIVGAVVVLFFPMHLRTVLASGGSNYSDTGHALLTVVGVLCFLVAIAFGSTVFGRRFGVYSIATVVVLVVFGTLSFMLTPQMTANLPTPLMGVWERINAFGYELWAAILATRLLRSTRPAETAATGSPRAMAGKRQAVRRELAQI